eukprot:16077068-Heterocapsa_arctica.AAC.1
MAVRRQLSASGDGSGRSALHTRPPVRTLYGRRNGSIRLLPRYVRPDRAPGPGPTRGSPHRQR